MTHPPAQQVPFPAPAGGVDAFINRWESGERLRARERAILRHGTAALFLGLGHARIRPARRRATTLTCSSAECRFGHGDGSRVRRPHRLLPAWRVRPGIEEVRQARQGFRRRHAARRSQAEHTPALCPPRRPAAVRGRRRRGQRASSCTAEFSRSGATYTPFPDPRATASRSPSCTTRRCASGCGRMWLDPLALDPSRESARVTREIAGEARRARRRPRSHGHARSWSPQFLMRCLFTMFAEDVGLLPQAQLSRPARKPKRDAPPTFVRMRRRAVGTWTRAASPPRSAATCCGSTASCSRSRDVIAARQAIRSRCCSRRRKPTGEHVEPAIFGTLLERALDPDGAAQARRALHAARLRRAAGAADRDRAAARGVERTRRPRRWCWPSEGKSDEARGEDRARSSTTRCATSACSTRPAASATSCTSRWNT